MKQLLTISLTAGLFAAGSGNCHARIGYTLDECKIHYGQAAFYKASDADGAQTTFDQGFQITVAFLKHRVASILYCGDKISVSQITDLLKYNADGCHWEFTSYFQKIKNEATKYADDPEEPVIANGYRGGSLVMIATYDSGWLLIQTHEYDEVSGSVMW